jgi:isoleucyl-tRNA synthetase
VALDLEIDNELRAEGVAREVVRAVQELRKTSGLAVEDRIELWLNSPDERVAAALETNQDYIAAEVLATKINVAARAPSDASSDALAVDGSPIEIGLRPV